MPRPSAVSFEHLRTLVALVRNGGDAAAAARELGINQPSMSKRLRAFQNPAGRPVRPWVVRDGHVWRLTPDGELALPAVQEIIRRYTQLVGEPAGPPAGPLVAYGCGQTAVTGHVRAALARFRREHPAVRVRIRTPRSRQRVRELAAGVVDLAEVSHDEPAARRIAGRPLVSWPLTSEPLVLVAAPATAWGAALAKLPARAALLPAAVAGLGAPMLLPEPGAAARRAFDRAMAGVADELAVELETGGWAALVAYAEDGHGAAVVSRAAVRENHRLVVRPLDPAAFPPTETRLIARRRPGAAAEADLSPEGEAFRRAVLAAARGK